MQDYQNWCYAKENWNVWPTKNDFFQKQSLKATMNNGMTRYIIMREILNWGVFCCFDINYCLYIM